MNLRVVCILHTVYSIHNLVLGTWDPRPQPATPMIPRSPLRDEVYRQLLDAIHRGELAPGTRVRDTNLATRLGVSRTPVREALLRLAREGVLNSDMGRGFRVPPLDAAEIGETGQLLAALEALALDLTTDFPADRLDRLAEIDRRMEQTRGDAARCVELEEEWHSVLLEGCPNRQLLELLTSLRQISRRYLSAYLRDADRIALSTLPHQKMVEAFRQGDRATALRALSSQWHRGIEELQAWCRRRPATAGTTVSAHD